MKKAASKILAVVLAFVMAFSCTSVAFAAVNSGKVVVTVKTDKTSYRVCETAKVTVRAENKTGKPLTNVVVYAEADGWSLQKDSPSNMVKMDSMKKNGSVEITFNAVLNREAKGLKFFNKVILFITQLFKKPTAFANPGKLTGSHSDAEAEVTHAGVKINIKAEAWYKTSGSSAKPVDPTRPAESGKYTVTFKVPTAYKDFEDEIDMPADALVDGGTLIEDLDAPDSMGRIFTGWYYDNDLTLPVGPKDTVTDNLTLYACFGDKNGLDDEFSLNYISDLDVGKDFTAEIVAFGLSEDEVKEILTVDNISLGKGEGYILEPKSVEMPAVLEEPEDYKYVEGQIEEQVYDFGDVPEMDGEIKAQMIEMGIDPESVTLQELREYFGIAEDDSVLRYLREELGVDIEDVIDLQSEDCRKDASEIKQGTHYIVHPAGGEWTEGETHRIEIHDTTALRFRSGSGVTGEDIIYHTFTVHKDEVNNLEVNKDMIFIPFTSVSGIDLNNGLFTLVSEDDQQKVKENQVKGTMTYNGTLEVGDVVAVYNGTLNDDNTVDGDVTYIKITGVSGENKYDYEGAKFLDTIFVPDIIPIPDDGSFDDNRITLSKKDIDFSDNLYQTFNLDADTVVEEGDFISFYTGNLSNPTNLASTGYGRITGVQINGDVVVITYTPVTTDDIMEAFELYTVVENAEIPISEESQFEMAESAKEQLLESGFVEESGDYIFAILTDEKYDVENSEFSEELSEMTVQTDTGKEIPLASLQGAAAGAKRVEVSKPEVKVSLSPKLQHYEGEGVRIEIAAGFKVEIELNTAGNAKNKIELKVYAAFEQEVVLGLDVKCKVDWGWALFIPYIKEINISASLRAGTYTGLGASVTIQTGSDNVNEDTEWGKLISTTNSKTEKESKGLLKLSEKLDGLSKDLKTIQNGGSYSKTKGKDGEFKHGDDDDGAQYQGVGGDLPTKYSSMLENDAEYIRLIKQQLFRVAISPDPLHLVEFSLEADLVVSLKINAMLGFGASYGNAKQYCFNIAVFSGEKTTDNTDLETPNFRADAYAFGMIGLRAGVLIDVRVGLFSTKLDSIGITAEAGFYAEVYGFVYAYITWESGKGTKMGAMGSLLFEVGAYLEINFVAQVGDGKLSKDIPIYSKTWPFVQLGATDVPMDFEIDEDDSKLNIDFLYGKNTIKLPNELYEISMMDMKSGELGAKSVDSTKTGSKNYEFTLRGKNYVQYNEENFVVTCNDLDGKDGKVTSNHSFQYVPSTNEVYVKPFDVNVNELWGIIKFTYRNNTFGFNTMEISRNVYVHWKGDPTFAAVEYYKKDADGNYQMFKQGEFSGFNGIEYDLEIDKDFVYQIEGCILTKAHFTDQDKMAAKVDEYNKISNDTYKLYKKGKAKWADVEKADADYHAAYDSYNKFGQNIKNVIKAKEGILSFLMVSNETIVKLYFDEVEHYTEWFLNPYILNYKGSDRIATREVGSSNIPIGSKILDHIATSIVKAMESREGHEFKFYYYDEKIPDAYYARYSEEHNSNRMDAVNGKNLIEITPDTRMPDSSIIIIVKDDKFDYYTVSWSDGKNIIDSAEVLAGSYYPEHAAVKPKPGYTFYNWSKDGTVNGVVRVNERTPSEDITLYPAFYRWEEYDIRAIYCISLNGGRYGRTLSLNVDEPVLEHLTRMIQESKVKPELPDNYTFKWFVVGADGSETLITEDLLMPAFGIDVEGRYVADEFNLTWDYGDGNLVTETVPFDTKITFPTVEDKDGLSCGWMLNDQPVKSGYRMPGEDITLTINWHKHTMSETNYIAASCIEPGSVNHYCEYCEYTDSEIIPIDPDNHGKHSYTVVVPEYCYDALVPSTCTQNGHRSNVYCAYCNKLLYAGEQLPLAEHNIYYSDFKTPTCSQAGYWLVKCKNCDYEKTEEIEINPDNHPQESLDYTAGYTVDEATCENDGLEVTCVCTACGRPAAMSVIRKKGHDIEKKYYWSDDYSSATATAVCKRPGCSYSETETTSTTYEDEFYDKGNHYCGERTFYARFENSEFDAQANPIHLEHDWGEPVYESEFDMKTYANAIAVIATRTCKNCGEHTENEFVLAEAIPDMTTKKASYVFNFTNGAFHYEIDPIPFETYKITLKGNYGTGTEPADVTNEYILTDEYTLPANPFSKGEDYTFMGWALTPDGDVAYADCGKFRDMGEADETVILYAIWEKEPDYYTIIFEDYPYFHDDEPYYDQINANQTSYTMNVAVGEDATIRLSDCRFSHKGFDFTGWAYDGYTFWCDTDLDIVWDGPGDRDPENEQRIFELYLPEYLEEGQRTITLSAIFEEKSYPVNMYKNDGTEEFETWTVGYWSAGDYQLPSALNFNCAVPDTYEFTGWATTPGGPVVYQAGDGNVLPAYDEMEGKELNIYAVWKTS